MLRALAIVSSATLAALVAGVGMVSAVHAAGGVASAGEPDSVHTLRIPKAADGHFWTTAVVNGHAVRVLVDTGSSAVALTMADARSLGLDVTKLGFTRSVATAAGAAEAAPVTLGVVSVAGAAVPQVHALVVRAGLDSSLLGMSYLGRLSGFSADREGLTLTP